MNRRMTACGLAMRLFSIGLLCAALDPAVARGQMDAGYLADVEDQKVTVTYLPSEGRTDVSLALVPSTYDDESGVTLMIRAHFEGRTLDAAHLIGIDLRAHYRVLSDDRRRAATALTASHALTLQIDAERADGITLAFYPASWGYAGFSAPGDEIPVAFFDLTPADLRALGVAQTVRGRVLWSDFQLTPAQVEALHRFAQQVVPVPASSSN